MEQPTISGPLWEEGKRLFYEELGDKKTKKLNDNTSLNDALESLRIASTKASNEYGEHSIRKDKKPIITIQLSRIMQRLEILAKMGDTYMECAPETVSLVWMSFRMIFTGFLSDAETCSFLTDAVDQISDIIFICNILEKRYLDTERLANSTPEIKDRILAQIPPLYAAVLKFSYQSRKLFSHGKLVRSFMQWRSQELQETLSDAQGKRRMLQDAAGIGFQEAVLDTLQGMQVEVGVIHGVSEAVHGEVVPGLKKIQSEQVRERELRHREEIERRYTQQLEWLKSGGLADLALPARIQATNRSTTHPGTADWILSEPTFKLWRDDFKSSLGWLYGEGGFGKSFVASAIIDHLDNSNRLWTNGRSHILYFYCRRGDEATSLGTKIFLHLLVQLYQRASPGYPGFTLELQEMCSQIVEETWQKLKPEVKHDSSLVKLQSVLQPLFEDLVEAFGTAVYIVVDGLDECVDLDYGLLDVLTSLDVDGEIHVMLSSRPDIYRSFKRPIRYRMELSAARSQQQISKYIKSRVKTIKRFTPKMRKRACDRIVEQCKGSFRCEFYFDLTGSKYCLVGQ